MPKITGHTYDGAQQTGKCLVDKHDECKGTAVIGIQALRRLCACQCHADSDSSDELTSVI
jgi:hypothetical protein